MPAVHDIQSLKRGVYFLANDATIDLAIAFLNSFRYHNPEIALCFIPFNSDSEKVKSLSSQYRFSVWDDPKALEACDEISRNFHENSCGAYRKLAMWDGIFDEFLYIDVDTIVLTNIEFVFQFLSEYDVFTSHSNYPGLRQWVWKDSIFEVKRLNSEQIGYSANTGFIVSKRSVLSLTAMLEKLEAAVELRSHMELLCMEQPLLNYYIVTSGCRYTSLSVLMWLTRRRDIAQEIWAGARGGITFRGKFFFIRVPKVLLVHWAGLWRPTPFDQWWDQFKHRLGFRNEKRKVRFFMHHKRLWTYYRKMKAGINT